MQITVPVSSHAATNGSQWRSASCTDGSPRLRRQLGEAHRRARHAPRCAGPRRPRAAGPTTGSGTAATAARREPAHHSSTIQSLYACTHSSARSLSSRLEERLPAEARERREAQRRLDPVEVHVVEARTAAGSNRAASRRRSSARPARLPARSPRTRDRPGVRATAGLRRARSRRAVRRRPWCPCAYAKLPPRNVISATGARTTRGPMSRYFAGRRLVKTSGGSTTWSSAETMRGIVVMAGSGTSQSSRWTTSSSGLRRGRPSGSSPYPRNTAASRNMRGGTCSSCLTSAAHNPKKVVNSDDTPSACAASIMFWHAWNRLDAAPARDLAGGAQRAVGVLLVLARPCGCRGRGSRTRTRCAPTTVDVLDRRVPGDRTSGSVDELLGRLRALLVDADPRRRAAAPAAAPSPRGR